MVCPISTESTSCCESRMRIISSAAMEMNLGRFHSGDIIQSGVLELGG